MARQTVRAEGGSYAQQVVSLHCATVSADGVLHDVTGTAKGSLLRALLTAKPRREKAIDTPVPEHICQAEAEMTLLLRRPTDEERDARVSHAVTPLLAAFVS